MVRDLYYKTPGTLTYNVHFKTGALECRVNEPALILDVSDTSAATGSCATTQKSRSVAPRSQAETRECRVPSFPISPESE